MQLPATCIRHPVLASVLSIIIVVLGVLAFSKLPIRYFPAYQEPTAKVSASITGASAEFMSRNVADKLIDAVTGIDSVETMSTDCSEGSCTLTIEFEESVDDLEYANLMNKLRSSVEGIGDFPPSMTDKPTVTDNTFDTTAASNILTFVNKGEMSHQEVYDYISQQLVPQFRNIEGVGSVSGPNGGSAKAVRVWLKPEQMKALNIKASDVVGTLSTYNSTFTAGTIKGDARDFSINPTVQVGSVDDVRNLVIRVDNGQVLRIKDVAEVKMGNDTLTPNMLTIDGHESFSLDISPFKSANPIEVTDRVKQAIERIEKTLPDDLEMKMVYNEADFIDAAISQGFSTLIEATVLVSVVVLLFLGSMRVSSIPIITIPVCVIGVFAVMYWLGFSINMLTILAIILAIGLVVDDAIVVVENCYRHIENGETPMNAALKGSKEIVFPVIAMTLTLAVVYLPIGLMSGLTADLFRQFAFTLAAAVIISGVVALTLSPMMSAYLLKPITEQPRWFAKIDRQLNRLTDAYSKELDKWFNRKAIMGAVSVALIVVSGLAFTNMERIVLPTEDTGFIDLSPSAPAGVGSQYHLNHKDQLNEVISESDAIESNMSYLKDTPRNHILLKPWDERDQSIEEVMAEIYDNASGKISAYDMSNINVRTSDGLHLATSLGLAIITADRNTEELAKTTERVVEFLENYEGLSGVSNSIVRDQLTYDLSIDHNAIVLSGVSYGDVTNALSTFLGSVKAADLQAEDGFTYPIQVQVNRADLGDFNVLDKIYVTSSSSQNLPLSQFVSIEQTTAEKNFKTYMGLDNSVITAKIQPGYTPQEVKSYIDSNIPALLGDAQDYAYTGTVKIFNDSQSGTLVIFLLALVFVYLILTAQFESFIDPLVILLTIPLCIVGALLTLTMFGQSINIYSQIGLLTLAGLVTKHGILIVEFANVQLKQGLTPLAAAAQSARSRLRPILMTSLTMILGSLPLIIAAGPGSVGRINIGLVLVGGLLAGTFFSLFVVPVAYVAIANLKSKLREKLMPVIQSS